MNRSKQNGLIWSGILLLGFVLWTILIQTVDVQPVGVHETNVGFSAVNTWFHRLTGVHMGIYTVTDWLGLVPIAVCIGFGVLGLIQWIRRKSIAKVDKDILLLGAYYILVILSYLIFEMIPINYRPILIDGAMEASYPSSTTLLVLSVMPTLPFQVSRRIKNEAVKKMTAAFAILFSAFMVIGRLVSGVHWLTDILGAVLLSGGLYCLYLAAVRAMDGKEGASPDSRNAEVKRTN
ncbi:MAG: phosphatase PAP2 family protein [Clostridia bacterium]|nr:phosphatase PAP2 family protein [Clostridia bacterium]